MVCGFIRFMVLKMAADSFCILALSLVCHEIKHDKLPSIFSHLSVLSPIMPLFASVIPVTAVNLQHRAYLHWGP